MKLLIVGDGNHQFIYNYVKWLRNKKKFLQIDVLTNKEIKDKYKHIYDNIMGLKKSKLYNFFHKIRGFSRIYRYFQYERLIKSLPKYDFIHIHFLYQDNLFLSTRFKNSGLICTIWGSDYYAASKFDKLRLKQASEKAYKITFTNELTKSDFQNEFDINNNKLSVCRFGLEPLEHLRKLDVTKEESKTYLGWDIEKLAITIGYNLNPRQQHLEVLDEIAKSNLSKDDVEIVVPITYAGNNEYKEKIKLKLESLGYEYHIYDKFMSDKKIAMIRKASDVMIQVQISDQFSGSMQEHLFARNVVVTGSWLPYKTILERGVKFNEVDNIEEISKLLTEICNNYEMFYSETKNNPEAILQLSAWENNISDWVALYSK